MWCPYGALFADVGPVTIDDLVRFAKAPFQRSVLEKFQRGEHNYECGLSAAHMR